MTFDDILRHLHGHALHHARQLTGAGTGAPLEGGITFSADKRLLDLDLIQAWLAEKSYWAQGRSLETVRRSIEHSLSFGAYDGGRQVAFARVVTDCATFGWLCDVFVLESCRGRGVGKRLVEFIVAQPELRSLRRFLLATRDAHGLYAKYGGFHPLENPERWMSRVSKPKETAP